MDRYIGRMLDGRYEILDIIGVGGMAVVYKARDHRLERLVAIKILKDENLEDEDLSRRFQDESRAVARLNHPNIVAVHDVSSVEDRDYIVMELIDGVTLKDYMSEKVRLNWRETIHFAIHIATALEHAHSRGLVHRDIKPHNVMVLQDGAVKVADFGIARLMDNDYTMTKEALGSVDYISPEQCQGGRVDNRSDLYALGVVMYEMITGRTPYTGDSPVAIALQHIRGGAPRPSSICADVPKGLEQIILKAMAVDLQDRYISASAMLQDLMAFKSNPRISFTSMAEETWMERRGELHIHQPESGEAPAQDKKENSRRQVTWGAGRRPVHPENSADDEDHIPKGRASTIAVVVCSMVAILAIIIFMILLTKNDTNAQLPPTQTPATTQLQLAEPDITKTAPLVSSVVKTTASTQTVQTTASTAPELWMKDLVGLTRTEAELILQQLGLRDITWVDEECNLPAGTVIGQSVAPNAVIDGNMTITVTCAAGRVTRECTFDLPFRMESYYLTILLDGRPVVLEQLMEPFRATATFRLTGKGQQTCQLFVDGELYYSVIVDFDAYAGN